jgi:hypothetical protein
MTIMVHTADAHGGFLKIRQPRWRGPRNHITCPDSAQTLLIGEGLRHIAVFDTDGIRDK